MSDDSGHYEALAELVKAGCTKEALAMIAAGKGLCDEAPDTNTLLHHAAYYGESGRIEIARALIAAGKDINARNAAGNTPLHCTVLHDFGDVAGLLVSSGANAELKNDDAETPLDMAQAHEKGKVWAVLMLERNTRAARQARLHEEGIRRIEEMGMEGIPCEMLRGLPRLKIKPRPPKPF